MSTPDDSAGHADAEKGASEPLNEDPSTPSKVRFTADGKTEAVDIVSPGTGNYGLTKSELMVYANDPTWRKIRWGMFSLFWLVWLGMLGASFAIIMQTSCPSKVDGGPVEVTNSTIATTIIPSTTNP